MDVRTLWREASRRNEVSFYWMRFASHVSGERQKIIPIVKILSMVQYRYESLLPEIWHHGHGTTPNSKPFSTASLSPSASKRILHNLTASYNTFVRGCTYLLPGSQFSPCSQPVASVALQSLAEVVGLLPHLDM